MQMPMVTSVELLAKTSTVRCSKHIRAFIEQYPNLLWVKIAQLPDGGLDALRNLQHAIDEYVTEPDLEEASEDRGSSQVAQMADTAVNLARSKEESRLTRLESVHKQSVPWDMGLFISSVDGVHIPEGESTDASAAPTVEFHQTRSTFTIQRQDGSVASVRFDLEEGGSNSAVLHIGVFDASEAFQHTSTTKLTVIGYGRVDQLNELTKYSTSHFSNLRTLHLESLAINLLDILSSAQTLATQCSVLSQLDVRDINYNIMRSFDLPLQNLDLTAYYISNELQTSLKHLLQTASTLSRLTLSAASIFKVFDIVDSAAYLHKQLSYVRLNNGPSWVSALFTVGSGTVESATLHIRENELGHFLSLPMVTELSLGLVTDLSRIKEIATLVFGHCRHLKALELDCSFGNLLEVIDTLNQAASLYASTCRLILTEVDRGATCRTKRALDLPLSTLDITSNIINERDFYILQRLVRASPALQELYLSVASVDVAQRIFDCVFEEHRPISTLSLSLEDGSTAIFSLEAKTGEDGALNVVQIITQPELDKTLFLPQAKLGRIDVVGADIDQHQAAEIANFVLCHCCGVEAIRFIDLPGEVRDVVANIKQLIHHGLYLRDLRKSNTESLDSGEVDSTHRAEKEVGIATYSIRSTESQDELSPPGAEVEERAFTIMRARQDGTLEAVELDCSNLDGVTLQLNPVAFNKSEFAQLANVTNMEVSIGHGFTMTKDLVCTPIKTFSDLRLLEMSLESSCHWSVLPALIAAARSHPVLEQVKVHHPDMSAHPVVYDFPIKTLDLTWSTISAVDYSVLESIIFASPSLSELVLKASVPTAAFKLVSSIARVHGAVEQLHLHDEEGTTLSASFRLGTGEIVSILVEFLGGRKFSQQDDSSMLALTRLPVSILHLVGVIQEVTINNPSLRCLVLKDNSSSTRLEVDIPIKKIDLGERSMGEMDITSLQRLLWACPLLTRLDMTVHSVEDLKMAYTSIGSVTSRLRTLSECCVKIHNGPEASVRYSSEDGSVDSIALWISDEIGAELGTLPMVRKIVVHPEDTALWRDAEHTRKKLDRIVKFHPDMATLEIGCDIGNPLPALLFLRDAVQKRLLPPSFRFRHGMVESNHTPTTPTTYDLPLQKLDLGGFTMSDDEFSDLKRLVHGSPELKELTMRVIRGVTIDSAYAGFGHLIGELGQLAVLRLMANDGYALKLSHVPYKNYIFRQHALRCQAAEVQVSGLAWPASFYHPGMTKLAILPKSPSDDGDSDDSIRIHDIISKVKRDLSFLNDLVLTCPIAQFFQYLPHVASPTRVSIIRFDLQDPINAKTIISTRFWCFPRAIVHLDNMTDDDLLDNFGGLFSEYLLRVEVVQSEGKQPEIDVSMHRMDRDEGCILNEVLWDTRGVAACRVFDLLDKLASRRRADGSRLFEFVWRSRHETAGKTPSLTGILDNNEAATALAKLLVKRASELDLEYEVMKALVPFMKTELEQGDFAELGRPFLLLNSYDIRGVKSPTEQEKVLEFDNLIPRSVKHTIHHFDKTDSSSYLGQEASINYLDVNVTDNNLRLVFNSSDEEVNDY
ncbi:hypothetical protein BGW39_000699 [Mortierella sp. 14UC]|nr:hypothetical protein BGW39_000699 [Mortierella sp. 14UC]